MMIECYNISTPLTHIMTHIEHARTHTHAHAHAHAHTHALTSYSIAFHPSPGAAARQEIVV
jgi:hypothetical protein